jgi:hypothetical protein
VSEAVFMASILFKSASIETVLLGALPRDQVSIPGNREKMRPTLQGPDLL